MTTGATPDEAGLLVNPTKVLTSYHYFARDDMADVLGSLVVNGQPPVVFADSGGFSAHRAGVTVTVDGYAEWLHEWHQHFTVYANLDVIGDHDASMQNLRALQSLGLDPLPVFHTHTTDMGQLEALCEEFRYVGVGGMVGLSEQQVMPWLVRVHKIARKHGTALHGFGQTSWGPMVNLPWYSVDSTNWKSSLRFGFIILFDYRRPKMLYLYLGDRSAWSRHGQLVRSYGFDPADFYDETRNTYEHNIAISMAGWRRLEQWLQDRHGDLVVRGGHGLTDTPTPSGYTFEPTTRLSLYLSDDLRCKNLRSGNTYFSSLGVL